MSDPYVVLGVDPSASDEAVKRAYRELVKKYHPDSYQNNPLSELAEEKMKLINEAYDAIIKERSAGGYQSYGGGYQGYGGGSQSHSGGGAYARIRQEITYGRLEEAERLLNGISRHDAEWHYLMGNVFYYRGWISEANNYFHIAARMEPGNSEYHQAVTRMEQQANRGFQTYQSGGLSNSDCCTPFLCGACLCNSCG